MSASEFMIFVLNSSIFVLNPELSAILNCCLEIAKDNVSISPIVIHSDSTSALKALKNFKIDSKLALECVKCIMEIAERRQVTITWTPAHTNVIGNLKADALAKMGAHLNVSGTEPFLPIKEKQCRTSCNRWMQDSLNERWRFTNTCSQTKQFIVSPSEKLTKKLLSLNKMELSVITGILSGHIRLNGYLRRIGIRDDPDCNFCGLSEESAIHFLCNCPNLSHIRQAIFGLNMLTPNEVMIQPVRKIYSFVRQTGRFPSLR